MTLNHFFTLFLLLSLSIYFLIKPYVINQKGLKNIPQLEFENFISYNIEKDKLKIMLAGETAKRYAKYISLENFSLYREVNSVLETLTALKGVYKGNEIFLTKKVEYKGPNNMTLKAEKVKLNMKKNNLYINVPFRLIQNRSIITGDSLFFNQNNGRIIAKGVKASINIQK